MALYDHLIVLPNRRAAVLQFYDIWNAWLEELTLATVIMIKTDHLKEVDDKFGHDADDSVLKSWHTA